MCVLGLYSISFSTQYDGRHGGVVAIGSGLGLYNLVFLVRRAGACVDVVFNKRDHKVRRHQRSYDSRKKQKSTSAKGSFRLWGGKEQ